ncbi:MAG: ribosome maturation factor RimP [Lachnoclostridium sp.]|nr:ribosome maturation factor RimP [Lachnoclostridium sp.]
MSQHKVYEQKAEKLVLPIIEKHGYEFVDVEYLIEDGSPRLRIYIDKEGGITLDDLTEVNHELSDIMDIEDFIEESYILEVSSPGLLRPFKKERDFERNLGNEVEIKLYTPFKWKEKGKTYSSKELAGILTEYNKEQVILRFEEEDETLAFALKDIVWIRKAIDF